MPKRMRQGKPIEATLQHVVFYPDIERDEYPTVVALHGRGADATDLLPLISALGRYDLLVVAPRAPLQFPNGGYAWYETIREGVPEPQVLASNLKLLQDFINEVKAGYAVDKEKLVMLGFSQGALMSLVVSLQDTQAVRGAVGLSGYLPVEAFRSQNKNLLGFPVFISHGIYDTLIPVRYAREARDFLRNAGADLVYREYAMGHEVTQETLIDLAAWLEKTVPP